jgi:Tropinone reductase 1
VEELGGFGASIYTCSRDEKELNDKLREWKSKGYEVKGSVCDLVVREQREDLIKAVSSAFNSTLNILINNAGTVLIKRAIEHNAEDYSYIMSTNFESPHHLTLLAYPLLKASGNSSIVFVSSVGGITGLPGLSIYAASKSAINQLTKNLACEWASDNIRVNTVAPWGVKTTISRNLKDVEESLSMALQELGSRTPLSAIAEPEEISSLVVFLCLPAASFITGQVIVADAGYTAGGFKLPN